MIFASFTCHFGLSDKYGASRALALAAGMDLHVWRIWLNHLVCFSLHLA